MNKIWHQFGVSEHFSDFTKAEQFKENITKKITAAFPELV